MPSFSDRVRDTTTTTGTGSVTLSGTAPTGFEAFGTAFVTGSTLYYCISSSAGAEWEVGWGTLTASTTLARTQVLQSSNADAAVNFSAGTKDVFCTIPGYYVNAGTTKGRMLALNAGNYLT